MADLTALAGHDPGEEIPATLRKLRLRYAGAHVIGETFPGLAVMETGEGYIAVPRGPVIGRPRAWPALSP